MKFRTYKVVVEVVAAVKDDQEFPVTSMVSNAMCVLLHEGSEDEMEEYSLSVTDVGEVTEVPTDPELIANYSNHDKLR